MHVSDEHEDPISFVGNGNKIVSREKIMSCDVLIIQSLRPSYGISCDGGNMYHHHVVGAEIDLVLW